jgi:hypothetical protein
MSVQEFFESVKAALQHFVVDGGIVTPEFVWLKELIATIYDWFAGLFTE